MFFQSFQQTNLQHPSTFPNSDSLELFGRLFSVFGKSEIPLLLKIQQKNKKNSELNISIFFVLIFKMAVSKKGCVITERTVSPQHCLPQRGPISKKFLCKSALAQATGAEMAIGASPPIPLAGTDSEEELKCIVARLLITSLKMLVGVFGKFLTI